MSLLKSKALKALGGVDNLGQVNIFTGKNNMGKSALLQSMYLFNQKRDPTLIPDFNSKEMHWSYDIQNPIELSAK